MLQELLTNFSIGGSLGFIATLVGSIGVYVSQQRSRRKKLRKSIRAELTNMDGLGRCATSMDDVSNPPPAERLARSKVPAGRSIPTTVYETSAQEIGILSEEEVGDITSFYSKLLRYKSIMDSIHSEGKVAMPDHEELHEKIGSVESQRKELLRLLDDKRDR